jgi:hypothetical protein
VGVELIDTKVCSRCHEEKPKTEFGIRSDRKSGIQSCCKDCEHKRKYPNSERRIKQICKDGFKICPHCGKEKSLDEFHKRNDRKHGFTAWCRECDNKKHHDNSHGKGICVDCGKSINKGFVRCYKCAIKIRDANPEHIKRVIEANRKQRENPIYCENILILYTDQGFWYGHPTINKKRASPKYCEIFKEVRPRVRVFFNHTCTMCGEIETNVAHNVHHVFYEKKTCCWIDDDGKYWTNLNARDHNIGDSSNYFALLCDKCHGISGGKFENRKKYADYLRKVIDEEYDGKSYYTEEEMTNVGYLKISRTEWIKK